MLLTKGGLGWLGLVISPLTIEAIKPPKRYIKFIYSENATKFEKNLPVLFDNT